jgi:hypothetical protein
MSESERMREYTRDVWGCAAMVCLRLSQRNSHGRLLIVEDGTPSHCSRSLRIENPMLRIASLCRAWMSLRRAAPSASCCSTEEGKEEVRAFKKLMNRLCHFSIVRSEFVRAEISPPPGRPSRLSLIDQSPAVIPGLPVNWTAAAVLARLPAQKIAALAVARTASNAPASAHPRARPPSPPRPSQFFSPRPSPRAVPPSRTQF